MVEVYTLVWIIKSKTAPEQQGGLFRSHPGSAWAAVPVLGDGDNIPFADTTRESGRFSVASPDDTRKFPNRPPEILQTQNATEMFKFI